VPFLFSTVLAQWPLLYTRTNDSQPPNISLVGTVHYALYLQQNNLEQVTTLQPFGATLWSFALEDIHDSRRFSFVGQGMLPIAMGHSLGHAEQPPCHGTCHLAVRAARFE